MGARTGNWRDEHGKIHDGCGQSDGWYKEAADRLMSLLIQEKSKRGVLIVDDAVPIRHQVVQMLNSAGYMNVHEARDALEAFTRLHELREEIYLIIIDIRIPDENGIAFFKHLTNSHNYPVGALVLTAYPEEQYRAAFFRSGTDYVLALDFFDKATEFERLKKDIDSLVQRVHQRRLDYLDALSRNIHSRLDELKPLASLPMAVTNLHEKIDLLTTRTPSFLAQLGLDLVRALIIALAVIALLYLGVGNLIKSIIKGLP